MQLVDLKKPSPKKKSNSGKSEPVGPDTYDHPYSHGLRVRLGPHEMQKLGNMPGKAGDYVKIVAVCKIKERTSKDVDQQGADEWEKKQDGESAELCIEKMAVIEGDDDADVLASEFADESKQND